MSVRITTRGYQWASSLNPVWIVRIPTLYGVIEFLPESRSSVSLSASKKRLFLADGLDGDVGSSRRSFAPRNSPCTEGPHVPRRPGAFAIRAPADALLLCMRKIEREGEYTPKSWKPDAG